MGCILLKFILFCTTLILQPTFHRFKMFQSLQELKAEMTANAKSQNINETVIKEEPLEPSSEPLMDPTLSISEVKEEPLSEVEQSGHFVNNHSTSFEPGEVHQPGCISNINNQSLSTPVENVTFLVINKEILKQPSIMKMNACVQASVRPHKRSKGKLCSHEFSI